MKAYCKVMVRLPEYIDQACSMYGIYRDIICELLAKKSGKLRKASQWRTWTSKARNEALYKILNTDFVFIPGSL